jgi:hypothetical protein
MAQVLSGIFAGIGFGQADTGVERPGACQILHHVPE